MIDLSIDFHISMRLQSLGDKKTTLVVTSNKHPLSENEAVAIAELHGTIKQKTKEGNYKWVFVIDC